MSTLIPTGHPRLVASQSKPSDAAAISLASEILTRAVRREGGGGYSFRHGEAPSHVERERMLLTVHVLDGKLGETIPEDGGPVVEWIAEQVLASFKARDTGGSDQATYDGFLIALPGRPPAAAREAVRRLMRNEAPPEFSTTFAPTPGDLARLTDAIAAEWRTERDQLLWLLRLPEEEPPMLPPPPPELTPEEKSTLAGFRAKLATGGGLKPMPEAFAQVPLNGPSPAARVAEETAARRARRGAMDNK